MSKKIRKTRKKRAQPNSVLRRIKEILHKKESRYSHAATPVSVYWLKKSEPINSLSTIYRETKKITEFYKSIFPNLYPKRIEDIKSSPLSDYFTGESKDIVWISLLLIENSECINDFVIHEKDYENSYLKGDYSKCENILDDVDKDICVSSWTMDKRIALKQKKLGLKGQKELAKEYDEKTNRELPYIFHYISSKVEDKVSRHWFDREMNEVLKGGVDDQGFYTYLRYKISGINNISDEFPTEIFMHEINSSIIDIYISYIRSLQKIFSNIKNQKLVDKIVLVNIGKVSKAINDFRIKNIALCLGVDVDISACVNADLLLLLDDYTKGDYEQCYDLATRFLNNNPSSISIAEIYSKCCIRANRVSSFSGTPLGDVIDAITAVLRRDDDLYVHYNYLLKESLVNVGLNYAYEIDSFIVKELSKVRDDGSESVNIGYLNTEYITPLICNVFYSRDSVDKLLDLMDNFGTGETACLYRKYRFPDDVNNIKDSISQLIIPDYRKCKSIANKYFFEGEYEKAIEVYSDLMSFDDELSKIETLGHYTISCINLGNVELGCDLIVSSYIRNNNLHLNLPFSFAVHKLDDVDWPKTIDVPILYFIYSEHDSRDRMEHLRFSFECYLKAMGVVRPSQLVSFPDKKAHNKKLIFFLEKICVYDVMKRYVELSGTNEIDKERIDVLNLLRLLNPDDDGKYLNEIKSIAQRLVVNEGVKSAGRSKIYVDTDNIKSSMSEEIGEIFERYKELVSNSISEREVQFAHRIREMINAKNGQGDIQVLSLNMDFQDDSLLSLMLRRIFSEFLRGEFGLNNYLSSRIRHGTLLNTLSNPLLGENILTVKDDEKGGFLPNEYWLNKVGNLNDSDLAALSELFSNFSEKFYLLIENIKNKRIQIKYSERRLRDDDKNDLALFRFKLFTLDVQIIKNSITENMNYDEFMDLIFEYLWGVVENRMVIIRKYFLEEEILNFKLLFEEFVAGLDDLPKCNGVQELKRSLTTARINFNASINVVSEWFNRAETSERNDFSVNIPLEIANKMICGFDEIKKFSLVENIDESISIKGRYLIYFIDIFYPLLDNVIQRSRLLPDLLNVNVNVSISGDVLSLSIDNTTLAQENVEVKNKELKEKISKYMSDVSPQMLSQEGGTGLYKIIKIIKNGLGCDIDVFSARFIDNEKFVVDIKVNCKRLLV